MKPELLYFLIATSITIVFIVLFAVLNTIFLKNKSEKTKMIPIMVVWGLLVAAEIWKIYYLIATGGDFSPLRYPLVMCSLVMYLYPLFMFKKNRLSDFAKAFSVLPVIGMFIAFVATQSDYPITLMQHHSYLYHGAMMAVAVYLITSGLYKFKFKDFFKVGIGLAIYTLFSTILSVLIGGDISIFGPTTGQIKFLYPTFGYAVTNLILCFAFMLASAGLYGGICGSMYLVRRIRIKAIVKKELSNENTEGK